MLLYLLLHALVLSTQSANITEEVSEAALNQTSSVFTTPSNTTKPNNVTSSSYRNDLAEMEKVLQGNHTPTVITEDDERFQDQQDALPDNTCNTTLLVELSDLVCGGPFHQVMEGISADNWCDLEYVIGPYSELTDCLEKVTVFIGCHFPNPDIQDYFLSVHSLYFQNCTDEDEQHEDAPHSVVVALTIIPVSLIPVLVYLVVWRS